MSYGDGGHFVPLIALGADSRLLSFDNLVEAHVLNAIRRKHGISMQRVRRALEYLYEDGPPACPLPGAFSGEGSGPAAN